MEFSGLSVPTLSSPFCVPDSAGLGAINLYHDLIPLQTWNRYSLSHFTDEELSLTVKELVFRFSIYYMAGRFVGVNAERSVYRLVDFENAHQGLRDCGVLAKDKCYPSLQSLCPLSRPPPGLCILDKVQELRTDEQQVSLLMTRGGLASREIQDSPSDGMSVRRAS